MQLGTVFDQRKWYGAGDVDDCAVVSGIQAAFATAPWCRLVNVPAFRAAAGHPDSRPGGLTNGELWRGLTGIYPQLAKYMNRQDGASWARLVQDVEDGHPCTVAVDSSKLPPAAQFGFTGRHRVTFARSDTPDRWYFLNPLAPAYSRALLVSSSALKAAVMAFGLLDSGKSSAVYISLPTDAQARATLPTSGVDLTPYSQEDLDAATQELQDRIDAAVGVLDPKP